MFNSGNCCGGDYFCYVGETCQGPNDVGDVNCCIDGSCTPAKYVIFFASSGSGSAPGTAAPSSIIGSQASLTSTPAGATSQSQGTSLESSTAPAQTAQNSQTATATSATAAGSPAPSSSAAATTSKSGAASLINGIAWDGVVFYVITLVLPPLILLM
jgi:hypothetical protein